MPRVAQSCALCGAPLDGRRRKYCEACCPDGMQVKVCSVCRRPFTQRKSGQRKTCSEVCQRVAWERRPKPKSSFVPFDCIRCGVHVASTDEVKGSAPHLGMQLCGPCKNTMAYAKSLGKTLAEHDADRQVELTCVRCGTTWLHTRRQGHVPKKCKSCAPRKDQCKKSTIGQVFDCLRCGTQYVKRTDAQKYCGAECAKESGRQSASFDCRCAWCDKAMTRYKRNESGVYFCKHECQWSYKRCVVDGVAAKPWPRTKPCVQCGQQYPTKSNKVNARCPECRAEVLRERKERRDNEPKPARTRFVAGRCRRCNEPFVIDRQQFMPFGYYCSDKCATRDAKDRRSARKRDAYVADVWRPRIYRRDGYRCQICGGKLAMDEKAPHPKSPTIDHIIPISQGGTHEPANCQAAHFLCNSRKSNGAAPRGDQLLLIG